MSTAGRGGCPTVVTPPRLPTEAPSIPCQVLFGKDVECNTDNSDKYTNNDISQRVELATDGDIDSDETPACLFDLPFLESLLPSTSWFGKKSHLLQTYSVVNDFCFMPPQSQYNYCMVDPVMWRLDLRVKGPYLQWKAEQFKISEKDCSVTESNSFSLQSVPTDVDPIELWRDSNESQDTSSTFIAVYTTVQLIFIPWSHRQLVVEPKPSPMCSAERNLNHPYHQRVATLGGHPFLIYGGCPIPVCFHKNPDSRYIMLFFHGNASDICSSSQFIGEVTHILPVSVLAVEYPGYGLLSGEPSECAINRVVERVLQYVLASCLITTNNQKSSHLISGLSSQFTLQNIILCGQSIGTGVAMTAVETLMDACIQYCNRLHHKKRGCTKPINKGEGILSGQPLYNWMRLGGVILKSPFASIKEIVNSRQRNMYITDEVWKPIVMRPASPAAGVQSQPPLSQIVPFSFLITAAKKAIQGNVKCTAVANESALPVSEGNLAQILSKNADSLLRESHRANKIWQESKVKDDSYKGREGKRGSGMGLIYGASRFICNRYNSADVFEKCQRVGQYFSPATISRVECVGRALRGDSNENCALRGLDGGIDIIHTSKVSNVYHGVPVLILHGDSDTLIDPAHSLELLYSLWEGYLRAPVQASPNMCQSTGSSTIAIDSPFEPINSGNIVCGSYSFDEPDAGLVRQLEVEEISTTATTLSTSQSGGAVRPSYSYYKCSVSSRVVGPPNVSICILHRQGHTIENCRAEVIQWFHRHRYCCDDTATLNVAHPDYMKDTSISRTPSCSLSSAQSSKDVMLTKTISILSSVTRRALRKACITAADWASMPPIHGRESTGNSADPAANDSNVNSDFTSCNNINTQREPINAAGPSNTTTNITQKHKTSSVLPPLIFSAIDMTSTSIYNKVKGEMSKRKQRDVQGGNNQFPRHTVDEKLHQCRRTVPVDDIISDNSEDGDVCGMSTVYESDKHDQNYDHLLTDVEIEGCPSPIIGLPCVEAKRLRRQHEKRVGCGRNIVTAGIVLCGMFSALIFVLYIVVTFQMAGDFQTILAEDTVPGGLVDYITFMQKVNKQSGNINSGVPFDGHKRRKEWIQKGKPISGLMSPLDNRSKADLFQHVSSVVLSSESGPPLMNAALLVWLFCQSLFVFLLLAVLHTLSKRYSFQHSNSRWDNISRCNLILYYLLRLFTYTCLFAFGIVLGPWVIWNSSQESQRHILVEYPRANSDEHAGALIPSFVLILFNPKPMSMKFSAVTAVQHISPEAIVLIQQRIMGVCSNGAASFLSSSAFPMSSHSFFQRYILHPSIWRDNIPRWFIFACFVGHIIHFLWSVVRNK